MRKTDIKGLLSNPTEVIKARQEEDQDAGLTQWLAPRTAGCPTPSPPTTTKVRERPLPSVDHCKSIRCHRSLRRGMPLLMSSPPTLFTPSHFCAPDDLHFYRRRCRQNRKGKWQCCTVCFLLATQRASLFFFPACLLFLFQFC